MPEKEDVNIENKLGGDETPNAKKLEKAFQIITQTQTRYASGEINEDVAARELSEKIGIRMRSATDYVERFFKK